MITNPVRKVFWSQCLLLIIIFLEYPKVDLMKLHAKTTAPMELEARKLELSIKSSHKSSSFGPLE